MQDLTHSISLAFQAEDVVACILRRSTTYGYENNAFQAKNDKKRKPNFKDAQPAQPFGEGIAYFHQ
jgi:hypothetical protein